MARAWVLALTALALAALAGPGHAAGLADSDASCQPDKLTVYKMVMHTFWSRDRFPKHYPDWRPPAQWSKVIGRSHDAAYSLFRLGQPASAGVRAMAESGHAEVLEDENQGAAGVFDEFTAPPVHSGAGWTQAEFFVDGNHSRVSLMSRIVPSPDWFVGIDSFDLCVDGGWIDTITIEVSGPAGRRHGQRLHLHGAQLADGAAGRGVPHHQQPPAAPGRLLLLPVPQAAARHRHLPVHQGQGVRALRGVPPLRGQPALRRVPRRARPAPQQHPRGGRGRRGRRAAGDRGAAPGGGAAAAAAAAGAHHSRVADGVRQSEGHGGPGRRQDRRRQLDPQHVRAVGRGPGPQLQPEHRRRHQPQHHAEPLQRPADDPAGPQPAPQAQDSAQNKGAAGLPGRGVGPVERVLQVVRHRRDAAAPDGGEAPAQGRSGVPATAGDQVVRLRPGLRQELLQVVNAEPAARHSAGA